MSVVGSHSEIARRFPADAEYHRTALNGNGGACPGVMRREDERVAVCDTCLWRVVLPADALRALTPTWEAL